MSVVVELDPTNPGHFFAACGLMELASRGCKVPILARFDGPTFVVDTQRTLTELLCGLVEGGLRIIKPQDDGEDDDDANDGGSEAAAPIEVGTSPPFTVDWWQDPRHGRKLKLWAGSMNGPRIAQAMLCAIADPALHTAKIFDHATVVTDPENPSKKVEPFYFDARRGDNANSRDVGFAPNDLKLETLAFPAVEILCFIGLQRFRPLPAPQGGRRRLFDYWTWSEWLPILVAPSVACGMVQLPNTKQYQFESWFRTDKLKAFKPARLLPQRGLS